MKFNFLHKIPYIKIHHHHHVITSIIIIFCILTYRNIVSSYCNMSFCNISYLNICIFRGIFSGSTGNMSGGSISNSCFTVLLPGHGLVLISFSTGQRDEHHAAFFIRQPQDQNWFIHTHRHTQSILSQHLLHVRWRDEWKGGGMFCRETRRYQPLSVRVSICCWLLSEEELHSEAHRSTRSSESIWGKQQYRTGTETAVALVSIFLSGSDSSIYINMVVQEEKKILQVQKCRLSSS